ncbi:hypothetical protein [Aeromonas phage AerS_266]|nr:hypothetical protein [Aeromonas phage AerS_266]
MKEFNYYREIAIYLFFFPLYMKHEKARETLLKVIGEKKGTLVIKIGEVLNYTFILLRNKNHIYSIKIIDMINKNEQIVTLSALGNLFKQEQINKIMNQLGVSVYKEHLENSYFDYIRDSLQNGVVVERANIIDKLLKRPKRVSFYLDDTVCKFYLTNDYKAFWNVFGGVTITGETTEGMIPVILFSVFNNVHSEKIKPISMNVKFGTNCRSLNTYLAKNIVRYIFQ